MAVSVGQCHSTALGYASLRSVALTHRNKASPRYHSLSATKGVKSRLAQGAQFSGSVGICINKILYYFPAFMIGYVCAKVRIAWLLPNWAYMVLPFAILALFVFVWYPIPIPYTLIILIRTILAYVICIELLIILSKSTLSGRSQQLVLTIERLSMGLYIFNQIMMDIVFTTPVLHQWFEIHWIIGPFVLFPIGFFPPLLLSYIFNKYKCLKWTIGG